ncbi:hypothetical protein SLEP1_g56485 [Rubroshorea leprosula]|uniref:Secreted protein n=1 Tax=Rubroshorea leprosula TaxID=152421 RepID=A0AAV5MLT8_9ROSI|nr:hypothetical protein SLEP1_g56485 [Rubroshorea leprosula]
MLEPPGFSAAQACWSRPVLPPPMTLLGLSAFVSLFDLATAGLDLCRGVLEISHHPLWSRLKGVPWLDRSTIGCLSDFTSLPPLHRVYSALLL